MQRQKGSSTSEGMLTLVVGLLIIFVVCCINSCLNPTEQDALEALTSAGFTSPVVTDTSTGFVEYNGCGEDDTIKFEAEATNPNGQRIKCTLCGSPSKGLTIRYGK